MLNVLEDGDTLILLDDICTVHILLIGIHLNFHQFISFIHFKFFPINLLIKLNIL